MLGDEFSLVDFVVDDLADDVHVIDEGLVSEQLAFGADCPKILIHVLEILHDLLLGGAWVEVVEIIENVFVDHLL